MSTSSSSIAYPLAACENQLDVAGTAIDLAILGNGFFVVRDPETNESYATQAGNFSIDKNGCVVTGSGARLQGRIGSDLSTIGDLQINAASLPQSSIPGAIMLCYAIDDWGKITVHLSDGSSFLCGQIMLQNFRDPEALVSEGNQLFSNLSAAGPLPAMAAPGSNGLGALQSDALELSNDDLMNWPI
jgi:flagellar hook protein FlgE